MRIKYFIGLLLSIVIFTSCGQKEKNNLQYLLKR